jgi:hypothetical protein|tara:strand:- start:355 stop:492 length:138 start_codon:yes stop_codon:yes gene_type:complete
VAVPVLAGLDRMGPTLRMALAGLVRLMLEVALMPVLVMRQEMPVL